MKKKLLAAVVALIGYTLLVYRTGYWTGVEDVADPAPDDPITPEPIVEGH